jgi:hypothetical protein
LHSTIHIENLPDINIKFQGDWGDVQAYNIDHHLLREGDRYTMESTHGDSWHIAFTTEVPVRKHLTIGFQVDYLEMQTHGKHHFQNIPLGTDEVWSDGVHAWSNQTWMTGFIKLAI